MHRTPTRRRDFAEAVLGPLERRWGRITKEYDDTHHMPRGHLPGRGSLVATPDAGTAAAPPPSNDPPRPPTVEARAHLESAAERREDSSVLHSGLVGT